MSNDTRSAVSVLTPFIGYAATGLVISGSNVLIVASIVRYKALRKEKEFVLLMALALADAVNMFNYVIAGVYRSWVYLSGHLDDKLTPSECVTKPHLFNWMFTNHLNSIMLVVISADRLFLVGWPYVYLSQTAGYAWRAMGVAYGLVGCMGVLGLALAFTADQAKYPQPAICLGSPTLFGPEESTLRSMYAYYFVNMPSTFALFSVFVFLIVYPIYMWRKAKIAPNNQGNNSNQNQLKRQKKLTKSLAISCVCTFCLYCVPFRLGHMFKGMKMIGVAQMFWILSNANPLANLVIYQLRIPELRTALVSMFKGKHLPPAINLWPKNSVAPKKVQTANNNAGGAN